MKKSIILLFSLSLLILLTPAQDVQNQYSSNKLESPNFIAIGHPIQPPVGSPAKSDIG